MSEYDDSLPFREPGAPPPPPHVPRTAREELFLAVTGLFEERGGVRHTQLTPAQVHRILVSQGRKLSFAKVVQVLIELMEQGALQRHKAFNNQLVYFLPEEAGELDLHQVSPRLSTALAQSVQDSVFEHLRGRGEQTIDDIAAALGLVRKSAEHAVLGLERRSLVTKRRTGAANSPRLFAVAEKTSAAYTRTTREPCAT